MAGVSLITGGAGNSNRSPTDFYPTPSASTISLIEANILPDDIKSILEPAAGRAHISKVLKHYYPEANIISTDLFDYGEPTVTPNRNFLIDEVAPVEWVITNPPYSRDLLLPFVEKSLEVATKGVAMFLKITFFESVARNNLFNQKNLKYVIAFANRQPIYKNGIKTKASNAIMYAWFVWEIGYKGEPILLRADNTDIIKELGNQY